MTKPARPSEPRIDAASARRRRAVHRLLGAAFWVAAVWWMVAVTRASLAGGGVADRVVTHLTSAPRRLEATFPEGARVSPGDPVLLEMDGVLVPAGVVATAQGDAERFCEIDVFPEHAGALRADARVVAYTSPGDVAWILKTLFAPDRLERMTDLARKAWLEEKDAMWRDLKPGLENLANEIGWALKESFPDLLRERRDDFATVGRVVRERAWQERLDRVFASEVWPLIEARAVPVISDVGDEIVAEVPVWAMSWAYITQKLPFTDDEKLAREVQAFLKEQAIPIIKAHEGDFRTAARAVLQDVVVNEKILAEVEASAHDVVRDPEFRAAMGRIVRTWILEDPEIRRLITSAPDRPDIRGPLERFAQRLEPTVKRIANMILLDDRRWAINPALARVLRRKLLRVDEDWILLVAGNAREPLASARIPGSVGGER